MDRAEQEDEQRLREVMCERRSVRISCDESSHAEAVEPPLRPFHTVSERLYEKALSTLKGGSTRLQESTRSCLSRCFWPSAPVLKPLSSLFHTVSLFDFSHCAAYQSASIKCFIRAMGLFAGPCPRATRKKSLRQPTTAASARGVGQAPEKGNRPEEVS